MINLNAQDLLNLSLLHQIAIVFGAGILTSFTPCVYPLIPITLSIFGARAVNVGKLSAFLLSLFYVLGICTTYTCLGLFSALTGSFFGAFLGNTWVSLTIGIVLIFFAFAGLDIFQLKFSSTLQAKVNTVGGTGFLGAYLMGLVSGVVAAPCTGPVLATILIIAGASGEPALGGILLFCHAFGLGLIFIVLGTFSGLIKKMPKSGGWLYTVKFLTSVAIFVVGLFFLAPGLKRFSFALLDYYQIILIVVACISSLLLGLIAMGQGIKSLKLLSVTFFSLSVFGIPSFFEDRLVTSTLDMAVNEKPELVWVDSIDQGVAAALENESIAMVDLYADWCAACKEYEKITFKDPRVIEKLRSMVLVRVDFTNPDEVTDQIEDDFKVIGLPTLLFLDKNGDEVPESRITGFLQPDEFLAHLEKIKTR